MTGGLRPAPLYVFFSLAVLGSRPKTRETRNAGMRTLSAQYDLASLPEPRLIYTAPVWFRCFGTVLLLVGGLMGGGAFVAGLGDGNLFMAGGGAIALAACLAVLIYLRPLDWRAWINLAATPHGLFLVTPSGRVVFAPWQDVLEIDVFRGQFYHARLTLRLPEESWARFGKLSSIKGTGAVRQYTLSGLGMPAEGLVDRLRDFRAAHA